MERQALRLRKLSVVLGLAARGGGDELDHVARPLDGFDQRFSPPPQPDLRGSDHRVSLGPDLWPLTSALYFLIRSNDHFGSAATLSVSGRPSSFFTTLTPCTSATIL